jgi:hypothetical protein
MTQINADDQTEAPARFLKVVAVTSDLRHPRNLRPFLLAKLTI